MGTGSSILSDTSWDLPSENRVRSRPFSGVSSYLSIRGSDDEDGGQPLRKTKGLINVLQTVAEESSNEVETILRQLTESEEQRIKLTKEKRKLGVKINIILHERDNVVQELNDTKLAYDNEQIKINNLQTEKDMLANEIKQLKEDLMRERSENDIQQKENSKLLTDLKNLKTSNSDLRQQNANLISHHETMEQEILTIWKQLGLEKNAEQVPNSSDALNELQTFITEAKHSFENESELKQLNATLLSQQQEMEKKILTLWAQLGHGNNTQEQCSSNAFNDLEYFITDAKQSLDRLTQETNSLYDKLQNMERLTERLNTTVNNWLSALKSDIENGQCTATFEGDTLNEMTTTKHLLQEIVYLLKISCESRRKDNIALNDEIKKLELELGIATQSNPKPNEMKGSSQRLVDIRQKLKESLDGLLKWHTQDTRNLKDDIRNSEKETEDFNELSLASMNETDSLSLTDISHSTDINQTFSEWNREAKGDDDSSRLEDTLIPMLTKIWCQTISDNGNSQESKDPMSMLDDLERWIDDNKTSVRSLETMSNNIQELCSQVHMDLIGEQTDTGVKNTTLECLRCSLETLKKLGALSPQIKVLCSKLHNALIGEENEPRSSIACLEGSLTALQNAEPATQEVEKAKQVCNRCLDDLNGTYSTMLEIFECTVSPSNVEHIAENTPTWMHGLIIVVKKINKMVQESRERLSPNTYSVLDSPTQLAEKYSKLYDQAWTDAYANLETTTKGATEHTHTQILLDILSQSYRECADISKQQQLKLVKTLTELTDLEKKSKGKGSVEVKLSALQSKAMTEMRIQSSDIFLKSLKSYFEDKYRKDSKKKRSNWFDKGRVQCYTMECIKLCWLMQLQAPPLYIDLEVKYGDQFDTNMFKEYKKSGNKIDFIVWPPLFLHEGGPVLCKGVAQGKKDT